MIPPRRTRTGRLIGLGALIALVIGVGAALWSMRPPEVTMPSPPRLDPGEDPVERTLRGLPADSVAIKWRWRDEVAGVEYADLDPDRRELFLRFANTRPCDCGCGYSLAGCKASDMECDDSGRLLAALLDSLRAGRIPAREGLRERP